MIAVNFHGSTGFGQKYVDSIRTDWGGQPYRDCMTGVKTILAEKHYLDPDRVGALGASYGVLDVHTTNKLFLFFFVIIIVGAQVVT